MIISVLSQLSPFFLGDDDEDLHSDTDDACDGIHTVQGNGMISILTVFSTENVKYRLRSGQMTDLIKRRFGRLTVVEFYGIHTTPCGSKRRMWRCVCDCGNEVIASTNNLNSGNTKSCGCYKYEKMRESRTKHSGTHDRLYQVWRDIKQRCNNPKHKSYKYYGGTGIKVCDEWEHDYSAFKKWAYKNGYDENAESMKCTIDRIDPYKDYMPSNCRWVDMFEQNKDSHKRKGLQLCT